MCYRGNVCLCISKCYYSAMKKNEILPCSNMDGHGGYYAKCNKLDREWQILDDITYVKNLKIQQPNE